MAKKAEITKTPRKPRTSKPKELSKNISEEEVTSPVEEVTPEIEETPEEITPKVEEISEEVTPEEIVPEIAPEETVSEDTSETPSDVPEEDPAETETPTSSEESPEEVVPKLPEVGTELPEDVAPFDPSETPESQDESEDLSKGHAYVRKLNPNLEDGKSKWVACVANGSAEHKIYKGSYLKAYTAADNYNVKHGLQKGFVPKLRK